MKSSRGGLASLARPHLALVATLVLAAMLFGGSSRYDVIQNVLMQPIAWLVAGFALIVADKEGMRALRWPLLMLLALVAIVALQLVPLPSEVWADLPGREPLDRIAGAIGSEQSRPASMVPWRTLNAFAALGIPLAALLVAAAIGQRAVLPVLIAIAVLAAGNAIFAFFQIGTGFADATYFYAITNQGAPVGIFANRNHSAVFGSFAMLVIAYLATQQYRTRHAGFIVSLWAVYGATLLILLVNGSRAGMVTAALALVATAVLVHGRVGSIARPTSRNGRKPGKSGLLRHLPTAVIIVFAAGLLFLFIFADRLVAFQRMVDANPLEDLRFKVMPILGDMISTYFPAGTGMGAFESAYRIHETDDLLAPHYLNMAHNDWLQWLIETGLPGLILLLAFLFWCGRTIWQLRRYGRDKIVLAVGGLAIFAIASIFDYPLRTPIFQVVGVWFICVLALLARQSNVRDRAQPDTVDAQAA